MTFPPEPAEVEIGDVPFESDYFPSHVPPKHSTFFGVGTEASNRPVLEEREHYLTTVHGFDTGGFEASVRCVDAQKMYEAAMRPRGARKPVKERSETDMLRSARRSKTNVRRAVKQIGCTHLLTMTTRENENTPEALNEKLKKFARNYRRGTGDRFDYVAVPERHPSNPKHWHLHVAITGWLKLNLARQIWWSCCGGRGMGNLDVKHIKVPAHPSGAAQGPLVRAEKIARYISKYMSKDLIFAHRPDKKRYWRSEFKLPEARRMWLETRPPSDSCAVPEPGNLNAGSLSDAFTELRTRLGGFAVSRCSFFFFPDGTGFWFSYNPDASSGKYFGDEVAPPF